MLRIDHLIFCVRDLDAAARRFEHDLGLASVPGGRHGGWGTANRIVPLGEEYLELVTVVEPDAARDSPFGRWVLERASERGRLGGWAVATDDIEGVAARLGLDVATGSRTRPDGAVLSWRVAGIERMLSEPSHPFFLQWGVPPELHPGRSAMEPRAETRRIAWIAITGDARSLDRWLGGPGLSVRVDPGPPAVRQAGLEMNGETLILE